MADKSAIDTRAFDEGRAAYAAGRSINDHGYQSDAAADMRRRWHEGWCYANAREFAARYGV